MRWRDPREHASDETVIIPGAVDHQPTVIIPAARPRSARRTPVRRADRKVLSIAVSVGLVLITLSGAAFVTSWAPTSATPGRTPSSDQLLRISANAAIPPTPLSTATATPKPRTPTATPLPKVNVSGSELCTDSVMFVPHITQWTVPPGCYATIYSPDPKAYPYRPGFGYCNWWVRERHLAHPDITENTSYPRGSTPVAGAVVWFDPNVQGASPGGHWAHVVAVAPDNYWFLVSEMNFGWRGGGFGKVDYRYAHAGPGVVFVYA